MKRFLCLVLIFLLITAHVFCEPKQSLSFCTGTGADSSFVQKNTMSLEWVYRFTGEFLDFTGGTRFTDSCLDFTFDGMAFHEFFKDSYVSPAVYGGVKLHSAFINSEAFLQDSFLAGSAQVRINPISTTLGFTGGIGFNSTHVWQLDDVWLNEFYPLVRGYFELSIMNTVVLGGSLGTFAFFTYDFWSPKAEFWAEVRMAQKLSVLSDITFRYTPNVANENIQLEGVDFKIGVKYDF